MTKEEKSSNIFGEKSFTILFSIFYIISVFYKLENIISLLIFILIACLIFFLNYGARRSFILLFIFFLGIIRANYEAIKPDILTNIYSKNVQIEGQIISNKQIVSNNRIRFFLNTKTAEIDNKTYNNLNSKILVNVDFDENLMKKISIGDFIKIKGTLVPPKNSTNPYQFDYKRYLENKDCTNVIYAPKYGFEIIKQIQKSKDLKNNWFFVLNKFEKIREQIIEKHSKNIKSPKLEILAGLVFGNETVSPDEKIKQNFKNSGLLHLLAASGLNVALIYGIWWWIASLIRFPYNLSILSGAFFVVLYTFMTGFPPSILRASIMLLFVLFGKLIDRKTSTTALVFFVGFLILLVQPKMFFDIGFQLSFMVTLGLVSCCPLVSEKFEKADKNFKEKFKNSSRFKKYLLFLFSPQNITSIVAIPLIAQLWVIPLQLHYFNNLAPLSVLANIAVVPFVGILSFIGFLSSIIATIPKISDSIVFIFDSIANPLLAILIKISEYFSSFDFSLISTIGFNVFQIFVFWALIYFLFLNFKDNFQNTKALKAFIILVLAFLLSFIRPNLFQKNLEIISFDVQNADSFLIKTPKNKYIMIDTGKKSFRGIPDSQMIMNPYFKNEGIKRLDYLIITHFDLDHCGGVLNILENFEVKNVIIKDKNTNTKNSKEIIDYLNEKNISYKVAQNNEIILKEENLELKTFKTPEASFKNQGLNQDELDNETSIITLLKYKNKNILFMGDSGIKGFSAIKDNVGKIDILKIGHHGAINVVNKEMLDKINPDYSIISSASNDLNHPHYSTINLLNEYNSKILTTKNYGFIKINLFENENNFRFYHFNSNTKKLEKVDFEKIIQLPFHKTKYFQDFIESNSKEGQN